MVVHSCNPSTKEQKQEDLGLRSSSSALDFFLSFAIYMSWITTCCIDYTDSTVVILNAELLLEVSYMVCLLFFLLITIRLLYHLQLDCHKIQFLSLVTSYLLATVKELYK